MPHSNSVGTRVLKILSAGNDLSGHGTHVCGSLLGNDPDHLELRGVASEARLAMQACGLAMNHGLLIMTDLFMTPRTRQGPKAYIYSNS